MATGNKSQKAEVRIRKPEIKTAIFYITDNGFALAKKLNSLYPDAKVFKFKPDTVSEFWGKHKSFIFIMASGIVLRTVAPLIKDKRTDPAVVVLDEKGRFAVSLLSGHLGGANKLAKEIADFLNSKRGLAGETKSHPRTEAVITTASDVNNLPAIDLWAKENDLIIEDWKALPHIATRFLNDGKLNVYSDIEISMPKGFQTTDNPESADMLITNKNDLFTHSPIHPFARLYLRPKNLVIGIGCNSGAPAVETEDAVKRALAEKNLSFLSIHSVATIDIKADEKGLNKFVRGYGFPIKTFTADELNKISSESGVRSSEIVFKATGAYAVAEPAALLASGADELLVRKQKIGNVTVAVAEIRAAEQQSSRPVADENTVALLRCCATAQNKGKIYIVGTGPGSVEHITPYAQEVIRNSDVIVGYGTYLELIKELIEDKEIVSTGMTQEIDRCQKAVKLAMNGKTVSVISGGDPGIYAMAGLVFELLRAAEQQNSRTAEQQFVDTTALLHYCATALPDVEVIPGISALNACAARLGAPLMHDFASISLSDRLTPWELIEKRLDAAAKADFVIILYNPKSKGRAEHIDRARKIILKCRKPETPVGIVKGAMRGDERIIITDLKNMLEHDIDMQTTVIIGNSQTFVWNDRMITPRGYEKKFKI